MNALRALYLTLILIFGAAASARAIGPASYPQPTAAQTESVVGSITNFTATPDVDSVAAHDNLMLQFVLANDSISSEASLELDFPTGFQLGALDSITYNDSDTLAPELEIVNFSLSGQHLSIALHSDADLPDAGTTHTVTFFGVNNPTLAGDYQVVLTIISEDDHILALPAWSQAFTISPGNLALFNILPGGIQQARAGTTLKFSVDTKDQFGNALVVGPIVWSLLGVPQVTGLIDQEGNFQAQHTGASRVIATYEDIADTTSLVYVLPGEFAYFGFTGGADSIAAGQPWQDGDDDVTVTAYDLYGNINYEYEGEFYFESSDPQAHLPASQIQPASMTLADEGHKTFTGSGFTFYAAGRQSLRLMQDGSQEGIISPITVVAGYPSSFNVSLPDTVTSGQIFNISITNARDAWSNPVSGQVALRVLSGGGNSPSGASPSLPDIFVSGGAGGGLGKLVNAGDITLKMTMRNVEKMAQIAVLPEAASHFSFQLDPVQPIGQTFAGTALLTALDEYGNTVDSFSAEADTVVITADGVGQVINNVLRNASSFVDGVANLTTLGVGYDGTELYVQFTATSESGIVGVSPQVALSSVKITSARLLQQRRYVGEDFSAEITVSNFGNEPVAVNDLRLYADDILLQGVTITPNLTSTIDPLHSQVFTLSASVPNYPGGQVTISTLLSGSVAQNPVKDSTTVGQLEVLAPTGISSVEGTLAPQTVNVGRDYSFSVTLKNENIDPLQLSDSTELVLNPNGSPEQRIALAAPVTVQAKSQQQLTFGSTTIAELEPGQYSVALSLTGSLGSLAYSADIAVADQVSIETPPVLTYVAGSLAPSTIFRGREADFNLEVSNSGSAGLDADLDASRLTLFAGSRQLTASLLTSQIAGAPDQTNLTFEQLFIPSDFPTAIDSLILSVRGESNGHSEAFRMNLPQGDLTLPGGASAKITGTSVDAPNAPFVNVLQQFAVGVNVMNTGAEPLRDIAVNLTSNGLSSFEGQITIDSLDVDSDTTLAFIIEASGSSTISELFTAAIASASGSESQLPATIMTPTNPSQTVVIQTPASLSLTSQIESPPQAQDGRVGPGDSFIIAASVINAGQASVGSGTVQLEVLQGGFTVSSPLEQNFSIGDRLQWGITASAEDDTARFAIKIIDDPVETNNELAAKIINRADTITVISAVEQVVIGVDFKATGPQLVSPGESYDILDLNFDIVGMDQQPYLDYIEFGVLNRGGEKIAASSVIQAAELTYNNGTPISAVPASDMLRFPLGSASGVPQKATIQIQLADQPVVGDFTLTLDSTSFVAKYQSAAGERDVPVIARFANHLLIQQQYTLVQKQLESSFFSYPNPFSPLREHATIVFNMETPQPSSLTIYTLTGDEVFKVDLPAPAASGTPVTYDWDGRNQAGQVVLNGVYFAVLQVQGAGEVRTKIAVMK